MDLCFQTWFISLSLRDNTSRSQPTAPTTLAVNRRDRKICFRMIVAFLKYFTCWAGSASKKGSSFHSEAFKPEGSRSDCVCLLICSHHNWRTWECGRDLQVGANTPLILTTQITMILHHFNALYRRDNLTTQLVHDVNTALTLYLIYRGCYS